MCVKIYSTSFRNKMKLKLQKTAPTIPAIATLFMIIVLLAGTTTTATIPAVLATTETVSIENTTDTEVTTQGEEDLADEEDENTFPPSTEASEMEPSDTLNQTETEEQEPPTTLPSLNNTNATTANATNNIDVGLDGRIVFAKSLSGDDPYATDIYVMNADGTEETRLTDNAAEDGWPSWSPDGEKIAFSSNRDEDSHDIYVMDADGSDVTKLTDNAADEVSVEPSWSPDGEKIAFSSDRNDNEGSYDIYVMNVDEGTPPPVSRPQQIIEEAISTIENLDNIPQGVRTSIIVLLTRVLDIINDDTTDGTGTVTPIPQAQEGIRLTNNNASDGSPRWSPDGERIAFDSNRGNQRGIFVMNADDGSDVTRLTDDGNGPAWSPDGEKIAFTSDRDAAEDSDQNAIYVMNSTGADSSNATRLTEPDSYYEDLDWSSGASTPGGGGSNATNNTGGGGGNATEPLTVEAGWDVTTGGGDAPATLQFFADASGGTEPYSFHWDWGDGQQYDIQNTVISSWSLYHTYQNPGNYTATVTLTDSLGQTTSDSLEGLLITPPTGNGTGGNNTGGIPSNWQAPVITVPEDITVQAIGPEGAPVSFEVTATETLEGDTYTLPSPPYSYLSCDHESGETFPIGETVVTCTAIGQEWEPGLRHTTQESFTITVEEVPPVADGETELPADGEAEQPTDTVEEVPPVADGEAEQPTNDTGGQ
jgi:Tol biopolymer transport system component